MPAALAFTFARARGRRVHVGDVGKVPPVAFVEVHNHRRHVRRLALFDLAQAVVGQLDPNAVFYLQSRCIDAAQARNMLIYAFANEYRPLRYFRHDSEDIDDSSIVLKNVKKYLAAGIPSIFGFYIHSSFSKSNIKGGIPLPCKDEQPKWGQAVVAVGYDDNIKIKNLQCNKETKGALLFRNSWGTNWGVDGYGWLPYDYVLNKLALDFWSLLRMEWVNTGQFGI